MTTTSINPPPLVKANSLSNPKPVGAIFTTKPIVLMLLDLLGFLLIVIGLKLQYNTVNIQSSLLGSHSGLVFIIIGLIMTLPFIAWTLKMCDSVMSKISV